MPRNGSGTYTAPSNSFNPAINNTVIDPTDWNATLTDMESALTDSLSRTGEGGMQADLDMGANDINNVKTAVFNGSTSGTTTLEATAIAGTTTVSLPAATDTLVGKATTDTLTNKSIGGSTNTFTPADNKFTLQDNGDATKQMAFELSGITTATTRTLTVPNASTTIVGTDATQTLTNKTIAGGSNTITGVALASLATQAAFTFVGNNTSGSAVPTAVDIAGLTAKASPAGTDLLMISDQGASGAWKKATISSIASAGSVASIAGNTGAFTLSHGITNSTNDIQLDMADQQGALFGLTLSTAGSSATFSVASGFAVDTAATDFMKLTSSINKTTSSWAVGSGNGALDTGTIANATWYTVYLIKRPDTGVVDVLISTSATSPTMPTNYTLKRRIGSILTNGSAQWVAFTQTGDTFTWVTPVVDLSAGVWTSTAADQTLTVPTGVVVVAFGQMAFSSNTGTQYACLYSKMTADFTVNNLNSQATAVNGSFTGVDTFSILTNTSAQIRKRSSDASGSGTINTFGWVDTRGRVS